MLIDATHAEETRVVVVEGNKIDEFDFESLNKRQLAGNIYLAKVTRVEPSLQAAFVDYGGNRHGFLAFSEIHPDYYQIPAADRKKLLEEEAAYAAMLQDDEENAEKSKSRTRRRRKKPTEAAADGAPSEADAIVSGPLDEDMGGGEQPDIVEVPEDQGKETAKAAADVPDEKNATPEAELVDIVPVVTENVAEDIKEEITPRKPRPRRYKIQEVVKVRQILLIQVVKEERGNKGAALTTYLSLAGRYCVLMPNTARGGGISRKITNVSDRKKLKDIAGSITVPQGAGLIIRTAGAKRTKTDIKRDYEYLLRQWEQIRDTTLKSIAPTHIYEEGSLIKRSIRDLYNSDIDEIIVDGERGYNEAREYMEMLMPAHTKNVKHYKDALPLFSRFQVETYLSGMFNPTVQLKSGGYIVIGITEALVAIDVNSGRATKENSIEDTARKTNLEAAEEVARQLRLRDLAGLIVIDFIDMEDRRNNLAVEKRIKDKLKTDRARIQIGRISSFGLLEMSRQRLRPGMLEASTQPCPHCHGTGSTRSDDSLTLAILRELEEEGVRKRCKEVLVSVPINIANYMLNQKREHVAMIENRFGLSVRIEADPHLISPEYRTERMKVATRIVPEAEILEASFVEYTPANSSETENAPAPAADTTEDAPKKRRRRRGGRGRNRNKDQQTPENTEAETSDDAPNDENPELTVVEDTPKTEAKPRRTRRRKVESDTPQVIETVEKTPKSDVVSDVVDVPEGKSEEKPKRKRAPRKPKAKPADVAEKPAEKLSEIAQPAEKPKPDQPDAPKRRGWWSLGK